MAERTTGENALAGSERVVGLGPSSPPPSSSDSRGVDGQAHLPSLAVPPDAIRSHTIP